MRIFLLTESIRKNYGVDRVVLEMYRYLSRKHKTSIVVLSGDPTFLRSQNVEYYDLGQLNAQSLEDYDNKASSAAVKLITWLVKEEKESVVVISHGWPFISVPNFTKTLKSRNYFIDYGTTPAELKTSFNILNLRDLRARNLRNFSQVIPISEYVKSSETISCVDSDRITVNYLGTDHFLHFKNASIKKKNQIFLLGRFESNYKGGHLFHNLVTELQKPYPGIIGVHLGDSQNDSRGLIRGLGILGDEDMAFELQSSRFAVSMSSWEGFNLPIAEAESLLTPTFCFATTAHFEVLQIKGHLCSSLEDMVHKISVCDCEKINLQPLIAWEKSNERLTAIISENEITKNRIRVLLIDVTNSILDSQNSGVIRVTRQLVKHLNNCNELIILPLFHDTQSYCVAENLGFLSYYGGPKFEESAVWRRFKGKSIEHTINALENENLLSEIDIGFLQTEVYFDGNCSERLRKLPNEISKRIIFMHDIIPILRPTVVSERVVNGFNDYFSSQKFFSKVLASTEYQRSLFIDNGIEARRISVIPYGGEISGERNITDEHKSSVEELKTQAPVKLLMISTFEPRKGHIELIEKLSYINDSKISSELVELTLIGGRYGGAPEFEAELRDNLSSKKWIRNLGLVDDTQLEKELGRADALVYASEIEGFGLPILEGALKGKSVIVRKDDCFLHFEGFPGIHLVDFNNREFENLILKLVEDKQYLNEFRLNTEDIAHRKLLNLYSWDNFAKSILGEFFPNSAFSFWKPDMTQLMRSDGVSIWSQQSHKNLADHRGIIKGFFNYKFVQKLLRYGYKHRSHLHLYRLPLRIQITLFRLLKK
jgi:hypothetical protein